MAAVLLVSIIAFFVAAYLFRDRTPKPEPTRVCCPHCKRQANRIKFSFDCADCGETVLGEMDLSATGSRSGIL